MHERLMQTLFAWITSGWLTLWAKRGAEKATYWYAYNDLVALEKRALEMDAEGWDTYFSTCPAGARGKDGPKGRIAQKDVCAVPALFMDCDVGKAGCPASKEELHAALMALAAPPTAIVNSGSGCHAYWVLAEPIGVHRGEELNEAKRLLRGFADGIAAQMGYTGFDLSASEPARVLRIPGTHNYKTAPPGSVDVIYLSDSPPYTLDTLLPYVAAATPPARQIQQAKQLPAEPAALDGRQILTKARTSKHGERFSRLWNGQWEGDYPSQSEADMALLNTLAFWTQGDASHMDALFRQSGLYRADKWDELHGAQTYGQMSITKALDTTTTYYDPGRARDAQPAVDAESVFARFTRAYGMVSGYASRKGTLLSESIDHNGEVTTKPLANFTPLIVGEITRDDGVDTRKEFEIDGVTATGKLLPSVNVPTSRFAGMGWVLDAWGADANLFPGTTIKDKVRYAAQQASVPLLKRSTVYTHTGWRRINGKTAFLYHGGAVGIDGISVELGGSLSMYSLPPSTGDVKEAATASMEMLIVLPSRVAIPLLAHMYLAPLHEPLEKAGCPPAYVLYLAGRSGSGKTTAATLGLNHFGTAFNPKRLPASFNSTANSVQEMAFELKDMPLLVDDYCPVPNVVEQRKRASIAHQLIRAWGDHAERGRMRSDATLQKAKPPRGLGLMSGEDVPNAGGESGTARLYLIDVKRGEIQFGPALTALQDKAYDGYLARAMRGYIEWLLPQYEHLPATLAGLFADYRKMAQERLMGAHGRQPEAVAWLLMGFHMALSFWKHAGALEDPAALWTQAQEVLFDHSEAQQQSLRDENPVSMFMNALQEMSVTGEVEVHRIGEPLPTLGGEHRIGFSDNDYIYLLNGITSGKVEGHYRAQGSIFPISPPQLWKRLADEGIIETWGNATSKQKYIRGIGSPRCVWVRRASVPMLFNKNPDTGAFEV